MDEGRACEIYVVAILAEKVSAPDSEGGTARVKADRLPAAETVDDLDFTDPTGALRITMARPARLDFSATCASRCVIASTLALSQLPVP